MAFDFPSSPSTGDQFVAPTGRMYLYDTSTSWSTRGDTQTSNPFTNSFRYRTIYTRGYVSCGYKNGTPWRNSNKTQHTTDITTNLGDILDRAASYKTGGFSDYYHYIYGMNNTHNAAESYVGSLNMATDSNRTNDANWHMKTSRGDAEALMNPTLTLSYIAGGGSTAVDKHNLVTEIMYAAGSAPACFTSGGENGGLGAFFGEFYGWISTGSGGSFTWSTETWSANGTLSWASNGQPKGLSSKYGFGYGALGSYGGGSTLYKFNDVTGGASVSNFSRPEPCGEENWQVGQNWGYSLGSYNENIGQTNNTQKVSYTTDSCVALGSDAQPKGHDGMSSGCCGTGSAMMLGGA